MVVVGLALSVACAAQEQNGVRPGIEVLLSDSAHLVRDKAVGLLTNQTGIDRRRVNDLDLLVSAGVNVTAVYSPEHGYRGVLDTDNIGHGVDSATGKTIWSLYGSVRAPTPVMLDGVDVLVVDLQDIGARTYTYISTTLLTMRAARDQGIPVVVLDRPNPIGGLLVQGPMLDSAHASFVGMLPIPLRHGMTLGELARLGNDVLGIGADMIVVPAAGWRREVWFDDTNLPWVRPSPSMPSLESATHYPGTVLFEGTNLSVGRGTPIAFQVIGAPWLSAARVVDALGPITGAVVTDTMITPDAPPDGKYDGVSLAAIRLRVTDRLVYDPTAAAVRLLAAVRAAHPDSFAFRVTHFDRLAGGPALREGLESGARAQAIVAGWEAELAAFQALRQRYLLYRP